MTDRTEYWARKVLELEVERKSAEMALEEAKRSFRRSLMRSGHDSIVVDGWRLALLAKLPANFHAVTARELSRRAKSAIEAEPGSILPPGRRGEAFYDEDWYQPEEEEEEEPSVCLTISARKDEEMSEE